MQIFKHIFGGLIVLAGLIGLFFPIIPGFALIILGLFIINPKWVKDKIKNSPIAQKYKAWHEKRKK